MDVPTRSDVNLNLLGAVLLGEFDNFAVGLVGGIKEGGVANIIPEEEVDFAEVCGHEVLELLAIDVMVHGTVENEVGKGILGLQQGSLVLSMRDRPSTDVRVLLCDGTHPRILDQLVELVPISNARLGESFGGSAKLSE